MKDPAFLFYSSDFLSGTMLMTDEEVGKDIRLLCLQHQKGHLKEKDMLGDVIEYLLSKLAVNGENGQFRTPRHIIQMIIL